MLFRSGVRVVPSFAVAAQYDFQQPTDTATGQEYPGSLGTAVILRLGFHLTDRFWLRYGTTIPFTGGSAGPSLNGLLQMGF